MPTASAPTERRTVDEPAPDTLPSTVVVHAAGAVAAPGLYDLARGSRVDDLLVAAGGPTADADLDRLNLAATLTDGERIWVPRRGELQPPPLVSGGGAGSEPDSEPGNEVGSGGAGAPEEAPVDLNTATVDELDTLPGIGPATAEAIVAHREANGPFTSVDQLIDVRGIGEAKLAQLRERVRV
jgi:competence protein ComEA